MPYESPRNMPKTDSEDFKKFLINELRKIAEADVQVNAQILALQPLAVAPLRPRKGHIIYADGINFNPGSGEGLYRHNGEVWIYVG